MTCAVLWRPEWFVGLSKPRYQRFEGVALDRKLTEEDYEAWCGV
jgi:hypothetical protein